VISLEISTVEVYKHGALYWEVKQFLSARQFIPLFEPDSLTMQHCDITFIHESLRHSLYFRTLLFLLAEVHSHRLKNTR
jgi:hypothetical protein